jgi:hypothetical protein
MPAPFQSLITIYSSGCCCLFLFFLNALASIRSRINMSGRTRKRGDDRVRCNKVASWRCHILYIVADCIRSKQIQFPFDLLNIEFDMGPCQCCDVNVSSNALDRYWWCTLKMLLLQPLLRIDRACVICRAGYNILQSICPLLSYATDISLSAQGVWI